MTSLSLAATPAADPHTDTTSDGPFSFAQALIEATEVAEIAGIIVGQAIALSGDPDARVMWSTQWPESLHCTSAQAPREHWLASAQRALATGAPSPADDDGTRVYPLTAIAAGAAAVLICADRRPPSSPATTWSTMLALAGPRMRHALVAARLQDSMHGLEQAKKLQHALFAIADMAGSELDMPEMLRGLHRIVAGLMYAENFIIALYAPDTDSIRFLYFVDVEDAEIYGLDDEVPLARIENSLTWYLIRDRHSLRGNADTLRQQVSGPMPLFGQASADWMGVPMLRGGTVRGVIVVQSYIECKRFSAADQALLEFVASHILTALERKTSQADLERRVAQRTHELAESNNWLSHEMQERERGEQLQTALYRIAELASSDGSMGTFYRTIHGIVGGLLNARNFYIALLTEDGTQLEFPYHVDESAHSPVPRVLGRGLSEYVMRTGKPTLVAAPEFRRLVADGEIDVISVGDNHAHSWLGAPLNGSDGVLGVIAVQSYLQDEQYSTRDQELLTFVSYQIASSLQRRRAAQALLDANTRLEQRVEERTRELREQVAVRERIEQQLQHQVMHDALTGLPNRRYLREQLERLMARARRSPDHRFAVLYLDVDRFKVVNDSLGHLVGDKVLREVARRLSTCIREPDVVARLSGDEFAILLEDVPVSEIPLRVAQRVIEALSEPMQIGDVELISSASIGIALSDTRYTIADDLLRDADVAMYRAKTRGRHRYELFDASLYQHAVETLEMEGDLRRALHESEFEPYFQPIVRLADANISGYEALLRWRHPSRGMLVPGQFLQVAEDNGSIEAIDWHMYALSCRQAAVLTVAGGYVSINVSPRHFLRADFADRLLALIEQAGAAPDRIRIELTEGTLLQNPDLVNRLLQQLHDHGVVAAIDDFGTGFSSLSYLHRFPLGMLKIDRSFVIALDADGGGSAPVVAAILALARALDMDVIAEGIETPEQRDTLLAMGCTYGQGYLFSRPQPVGAFVAAH